MLLTNPEVAGRASLRVLVVTVTAGGFGGMQRHTHLLVRGLVEAGHDVEVVCPSAPGLAADLYGAHWTHLKTSGRDDPEWSSKIIAAYAEGEARAPFDVVHSESTSAAPLVRRGIEAPVAVMYHGNYLGLAKAHLKRAAARPRSAAREGSGLTRLTWRYLRDRNAWAFRRCEVMVVSHQQVRDTARSGLVPPERIHVVPNGVDVSVFRPRDRSRARRELGVEEGVVLVSVGRLNHEKGFDVALNALARLAPDYPQVRLLVVGDGEERLALENLALHLGLDGRTQFVGAQPQERVAEYLVASDVFVFPTRRDEAGPLVVPQAMACGLPVVASKIGGVTEVLEPPDGPRSGLLAAPGSVIELEAALRRLLDDPTLRSSLGAAARERAIEEYSLETMITRTVDVYRTAIARFRRGQ
jgi:phosphatidylinositol alpha-1,6-mannosyltransferase